MIGIISIDLDGTLLGPDAKISKKNRDAVKQCLDHGIKIVCNTGKTVKFVSSIIGLLGLKDFQIASGGTVIMDCKLQPVFTSRIPEELYYEIVEFQREIKTGFVIHCLNGETYYEIENEYFNIIVNSGEVINKVPDLLAKNISNQALMFTYAGIINNDSYNELLKKFGKKLKIRRGGRHLADIFSNEGGKVNAIKRILSLYDMERENLMAIGDNENDIGVIKFAGLGIAMGNSSERVKNEADSVVSDNSSDGVAEAIYKFVLL
jgi:Cof subfamily protein (haloacid dehalogenase superfamily)